LPWVTRSKISSSSYLGLVIDRVAAFKYRQAPPCNVSA
jgi:hypothetical protein